jgi:hypothetical protein
MVTCHSGRQGLRPARPGALLLTLTASASPEAIKETARAGRTFDSVRGRRKIYG